MRYDAARALELLRLGVGDPNAEFREGQEQAIRRVVEDGGRLLVVQATGWGKSFVYFIATKLLREHGMGPALLVSPLLSLMRNQLEAANRMGVSAERWSSDNTDDHDRIQDSVQRGDCDILLLAPEQFANDDVMANLLGPLLGNVSLLIVDEAHCISDWGHDFRPDYQRIARIAAGLPRNTRLLATTATANNRVVADLREQLGPELEVLRGPLARPSLLLQAMELRGEVGRLAWLAQYVPALPCSGIIYTLTIRTAERVAEWLRHRGIDACAYTGKMDNTEREELEQRLLTGQVKVLVATSALGMGFDKPDLGFVVHFQTPGSVVTYYQQVGRAGRALDGAYGVLLSGTEDTDITSYFIERAFPTRDEVRQVLDTLEDSDGLSVPMILSRLNLRHNRVKLTLKLLELLSPAPVVRDAGKWHRTAASVGVGFWRSVERLTETRRREQGQMQEYLNWSSEPIDRMDFLIRALDGELGAYQPPDLPPVPSTVEPDLETAAGAWARRTHRPIQPRRQWPLGGMTEYGLSGRIPTDLQAQEGRALSVWGDAGWGSRVRTQKNRGEHFDDHLIEACAGLVRRWRPDPPPRWVTCVPSHRNPALVSDFASRLAGALDLRFDPVIETDVDRPQQKLMENSTFQARNVDGAFSLRPDSHDLRSHGPVLLVDDAVDSRWTMTVCAWLLRRAGCDTVWPIALADASSGG